jgi:murein DD-endopeptidase MepM/ murein hydrolase activator NlpD
MNKFFYFSKSKLEYIEIKNFSRKFVIALFISSFLMSFLFVGGFFLFKSLYNSNSDMESLKIENKGLAEKYKELLSLYKEVNSNLDSLLNSNDDLRIAADLPPISKDEKEFGSGGSAFETVYNFLKEDSKINLNDVDTYIENIKNKIEFERKNYFDVSNKLKENQLFFASLPAIKPTNGTFAVHGFGMRLHPVLKINRMHEGVDILTNIGTPVIASGGGRIDFVGYKGGLGLCVEIDHGFGYRTVYGHLSSSLVSINQKISRGQLIAKTGNTGLSSGPHLHYEIQHNGVKLNPMDFIFDDLKIFDPTIKK